MGHRAWPGNGDRSSEVVVEGAAGAWSRSRRYTPAIIANLCWLMRSRERNMAVEEHEMFGAFVKAFDKYAEAVADFKRGKAGQVDVDATFVELEKLRDKLDS